MLGRLLASSLSFDGTLTAVIGGSLSLPDEGDDDDDEALGDEMESLGIVAIPTTYIRRLLTNGI